MIQPDDTPHADAESLAPEPPSTLGQTPHEPKVRPWELELLISGALVFGLIQLPGQMDAWFNHVFPTLDGGFASAAFLAWIYVKLALYAVIAGFVLHLAIRAYWVGVIGLEAVYPGGIAWEKTRSGPILREVQRKATPSLQALIDGADRKASLVFAGGLTLALVFVTALVMVAVAAVLFFATIGLVVHGVDWSTGLMAIVLLFVAPMFIAMTIDRRWGHRLDPGGRTARLIRAVGSNSMRVTRFTLFQPLFLTILTNLRAQRRATVFLAFLAMGGVVMAGRDRLFAGSRFADGYAWLPDDPGPLGVDPQFYDDKRDADDPPGETPSIQSDIVREPYVRLFIPYRPRRHNDLIANGCAPRTPGRQGRAPTPPHPATEPAERAVLACLAALQPVSLNGRPLSAPFRFYTQPGTGVRGIVAYIPVQGLPRGENLLTIARLPLFVPDPKETPRPPFSIPFWL